MKPVGIWIGSAFKQLASGWVAWFFLGLVTGFVTFSDGRIIAPTSEQRPGPSPEEIERAVMQAEEQAKSIQSADNLRPGMPLT